jgi:hypothetical protein
MGLLLLIMLEGLSIPTYAQTFVARYKNTQNAKEIFMFLHNDISYIFPFLVLVSEIVFKRVCMFLLDF